jgi:hypothetical protein
VTSPRPSRDSSPEQAVALEAGAVLDLPAFPELSELDAPPQASRVVALAAMALTVVAAVGTLVSIRGELAYFTAPDEVIELGDATRLDPTLLVPNSFVRIAGTPTLAHQVEYKRGATGAAFVVFPLAGQRTVFVELPAAEAHDSGRLARGEFEGRLVTFGELGARYGEVSRYLASNMELPVTGETFLLRADEAPRDASWALAVAALCLALIAFNVAFLARWFRPL